MVGPDFPVPASFRTPASGIPLVDHPEVFVGPTATVKSPVGSLAVTIAAPPVVATVPPQQLAVSIKEAYEALLGTCRSVGVAESNWVVKGLTAAQA